MSETELEYALWPGSGLGESFHAAGLDGAVPVHGGHPSGSVLEDGDAGGL